MAVTKVQITGGAFMDSEGNPLANGTLRFVLSEDCSIAGAGQLCAGISVVLQLDSNGNVVTSPEQYLYPNPPLVPSDSEYFVYAYDANGQLSWGPQAVTIANTNPFSLTSVVPS